MFYPTFFNLIDVEVINPHSRKTRAGTHPIYLECVPIGAQGTFSLLYVPFDLIGKEESDIKQQSLADLELIAEGLSAMFLTYGFSAKRTSGIWSGGIRLKKESPPLPVPSAAPKPKYLQAPGKLKTNISTPMVPSAKVKQS
jgi:CRISPR-associated protein Cmr2